MKNIADERGSILVTAIILLIVLGTVGISFAFWLSVQSKGTYRNKINTKASYYGETGVQKAVQYIQANPGLQQRFLDNCTTDVFTLNLAMEDNTIVEISVWDIP